MENNQTEENLQQSTPQAPNQPAQPPAKNSFPPKISMRNRWIFIIVAIVVVVLLLIYGVYVLHNNLLFSQKPTPTSLATKFTPTLTVNINNGIGTIQTFVEWKFSILMPYGWGSDVDSAFADYGNSSEAAGLIFHLPQYDINNANANDANSFYRGSISLQYYATDNGPTWYLFGNVAPNNKNLYNQILSMITNFRIIDENQIPKGGEFPTNWVTYKNKEQNFQIQIPSTWNTSIGQGDLVGNVLVNDQSNKLEMVVWNKMDTKSNIVDIGFQLFPNNQNDVAIINKIMTSFKINE